MTEQSAIINLMELFNFFKTLTLLITTIAASVNIATTADTGLPRRPAATAQEYQTEEVAEPVSARPLDTQSIVGLLCAFVNVNPESEDFNKKKYQRASGVIVNVDGFILTNHNVADPGFYDPETWQEYQLEGCQAGPTPKEYRVPEEDELKTISPFIQVPVLSYIVEPVFIPNEPVISDYEQGWLDFSLFVVTGLNPDAKFFGITSLPEKFPYTPILISETPIEKEKLISFGYPAGTTIGLRASISTIFVQGLLSHITDLWTGDQRFQDELFLIQSKLDTGSTAEGGRFGSPIFWKGYIVGIHIYKQDSTLNIYNLGIQPIVDILESNGITMFDEVY